MKFTGKKIIFILLTLALSLILFNVKVYAEGFSLEKESIEILLNNSVELLTNNNDYTKEKIWKSSDESIVTVDNEGKIKGLKIGTATITVTQGDESDSCEVNVVYGRIIIFGNAISNIYDVNLILNEHDNEQLIAKVEDGNGDEAKDAIVTWESSDKSIVSVDNTGKIKGLKPGTATISAKAAGVVATCQVNVFSEPEYTDFSNAKYQLQVDKYNKYSVNLKISGIANPQKNSSLYYVITPDNVKPEIKIDKYGSIDLEGMGDIIEQFYYDEENECYHIDYMEKYTELNQDMYIWIIENAKLDNPYSDLNGELIQYSNKFVVEGKKIERIEMVLLDDIIYYINISDKKFEIDLYYPLYTEDRKFTVKIGEVTDKSILLKIKNDDYSGIKDLLSYSKNNTPVFTTKLEFNKEFNFGVESNENLIGNNVLKNNAYYYIYVELDTENGKYYPVEGINLYQAYNVNGKFGIQDCKWEYWDGSIEDDEPNDETTADKNKQDAETTPDTNKPNNTTTPDKNKPNNTTTPDKNKPTDTTTSNKEIPHTGIANTVAYIAIILSILGVIIGIIKYKKYQY